jgi:hypothetical protein
VSTKRIARRRTHHVARWLEAWETFFLNGGEDWFHQLDRLGLDDAEIKRQAPLVWAEHGLRFMTIWRAEYGRPGLPHGAKKFGVPPGA